MQQTTVDISIIVFGVISTIGIWALNEWRKRVYEEYKRKEERYIELIRSIKGFYISSQNKELKNKFLSQLNLCWIYCPDEVIKQVNKFLNMVSIDKYSDDEKEKAVGEFVLAMRKDLFARKILRKTELKPEDFKHWKAT